MTDTSTPQDGPDEQHRVPAQVDAATVEAVGRLTEARETTERARGCPDAQSA